MSQRIAFLEKQLAARTVFAEQTAEAADARPNNQGDTFFARKDAEYVSELKRDLAIAKAERERELFEVRLHGGPIGLGSMPLRLFAKFIDPFVAAIEHAAYRLHTGKDAQRGTPVSITNALDMQLAGLRSGSARLMLTGKLSPDLGGASVLENTLIQIFRLLEDEEQFWDAVDAIGVKSARKMAEAFKPLEEAGSGMDMNWSAPNGRMHAWASDSLSLLQFRNKIATLNAPEEFERTISGTVRALKDNGVIEIRDKDDVTVRVRYSMSQHEVVSDLCLWMHVSMRVRTERTHDPIAGKDIDRNHLISIRNAE